MIKTKSYLINLNNYYKYHKTLKNIILKTEKKAYFHFLFYRISKGYITLWQIMMIYMKD